MKSRNDENVPICNLCTLLPQASNASDRSVFKTGNPLLFYHDIYSHFQPGLNFLSTFTSSPVLSQTPTAHHVLIVWVFINLQPLSLPDENLLFSNALCSETLSGFVTPLPSPCRAEPISILVSLAI